MDYFFAIKVIAVYTICISAASTSHAQKQYGIPAIEKAYEEKKYDEGIKMLRADIAVLKNAHNADSLNNYIIWTGKLEAKKSDNIQAAQKVNELVASVKLLAASPTTISQAYIEAGEFFGLLSNNQMSYQANEQALQYANMATGESKIIRLANIENNMAAYAQRMGDISVSISHDRKALQWLAQLQKPNYEKYYLVYNSMGTGMYYISKLDSGIYFFNKAIDALSKAAPTPENKYYRPAIIQNNIAGIYGIQGKTTDGIAAMKSTIINLRFFLATKEPHKKKANALEFQFEATDNLAGIYKGLGDYKQAQELLYYSYQQKMKQLPVGNDGVFKSEILLGQLYYAIRDYNKALQFLNRGLTKIASANGDYLFWQADACNTLALLYEAKKDNVNAAIFYDKSDSLYEASLEGEYDNIYLEFLTNKALFYALAKQEQKAIAASNKGYNYVVKAQGAQSLYASYQLLNLSQVYYLLGRYVPAIKYANEALIAMNVSVRSSHNLLDSVATELKKPNAVLARAKAQYELLPQKNVADLTAMLKELDEALALLEKRKSVIGGVENNSLLVADYSDLLDFIKKINFDLFQLTKNTGFIDRMIGLHESGIYNRIRSRLNQNDSMQFVDVPPAILVVEKNLKTTITNALQGEGTHDEKMKTYLTALEQWNHYQGKLRAEYPRYYAMRYASITKSLPQIQQGIPAGSTVIRYFYIGKKLYAMVAEAGSKNLYELQSNQLENQITALSQKGMDATQTGELLYTLYHELWQPLLGSIHNRRIVVIPDGILYNLSFETLTPQKIVTFKELATKSLLASYTISYHYSLLLLEPAHNAATLTSNFVAFAPGFSDEMKAAYKASAKAVSPSDNSYLSLLPQPFMIDLATKIGKYFGGSVYLKDQSTVAVFKANAGHHKIIHIGTHAESDNLHPEYSRLIFVKSGNPEAETNSLFLPEIYNCDLTSGLTVLTACESGKPGYQDGEGMISLAHAFNYAGSESILTGLWKIDEQASMLLIDQFYKNLATGLPKDEALRQAKLHYIQNSQGRMLSPEYWAGLIIMGDTSPLHVEPKKSFVWFWAGAGVLVLLGLFFFGRKRK